MFSEQQMMIFKDRYALKDRQGNPVEDSPVQMWHRVAQAIGNTPGDKALFHRLLSNFRFVPGGRILASAGSGQDVTAYNCYVIPVEPDDASRGRDSREAIFDTIKRMVGIMSRGGGVGINWSTLRPTGAHLERVNGTSSGPIGWMDVASRSVGEVIQGGSRRGAAMFMLSDWHPDLQTFINAKRDLNKITNANISVAISDAFMKAVQEDLPWSLMFPHTDHPAYNGEWDGDLWAWVAKYPEAVTIHRIVSAKSLWHQIAESAWASGEPGIVFLERCQKESTASEIEKIVSVNPCGEQPLGEYSVCNLGAMNLAAYVVDKHRRFNWEGFRSDVRTAIRFLDSVIDKTYYIEELPRTRSQQELIRRVGLGVMGLADALILLGVRYGTSESVDFVDQVFSTMKSAALTESAIIASTKGPASGWNKRMLDRPFLSRGVGSQVRELIESFGLRNILLLTVAPTGTTSQLAGVNSGIEPYFAFGYWREDRLGRRFIRAPIFDGIPPERWTDPSLVSSLDISVDQHIAIQATAQQYVDASISKTINAPNSHTVEDTERAYMEAYRQGLKGIAYFRDGCGRDQVLTRDENTSSEHQHEYYKENGCTYCRGCTWSACDL